MNVDAPSLMTVYKGWDDYQISLLREQLVWRPAPHLRSVGEIASHIIGGRIQWFHYILGEGSAEFASRVAARRPEDVIEENPAELVRWLEATWQMIEDELTRWGVADLAQTYQLPYQGKTYALTRQWMILHILAHDFHHGGELAFALGMQGISLPELGDEGGHLSERSPLAEPS